VVSVVSVVTEVSRSGAHDAGVRRALMRPRGVEAQLLTGEAVKRLVDGSIARTSPRALV